jgi:hypothetical protein
MSFAAFRRSIRHVASDRRGVTGFAFVAASAVMLGTVAVATDAGLWYSARRGAFAAADVAAGAGAHLLATRGQDPARSAALDLAARNGFPHGGANEVVVNIPPQSGANIATPNAVEVIVRQRQPMTAAGLFLPAPPTVRGRAVAAPVNHLPACFLALGGEFRFTGSPSINAPDCALASNRAGATRGFDVSNNSNIVARSMTTTAAECHNCDAPGVRLADGHAARQIATDNPYRHLDSKLPPRFATNAGCIDPGKSPTRLLPYERNGRRAFCKDIDLAAGTTLVLVPGTYYLNNASLTVRGGATIDCPTCGNGQGVTFVLTGDPNRIGQININGGATLRNLRAPTTPDDPDFRGVLFYRDGRATTGGVAVKINGGGTALDIRGGLYFPSSSVEFSGGADVSGCIVLVARSIELKGNSVVGTRACDSAGTAVPRTRIAMVVE